MAKKINKILLVRPDAIGDVVLMIPLINSIKATFPDSQIVTLQQGYTKALLDNHPNVSEVIVDWKKSGKIKSIRDFFTYAAYLKSFHFDAVIFSYIDMFYAALAIAAGIPIRVGDKNRLLQRLLLTHPIKQNFRNLMKHETEQNIDLLYGLTDTVAVDHTMNLFYEKETDRKKNSYILIHPTTGGGNRAWLSEKYSQLIDRIHDQTDLDVIVSGSGQKDIAIAEKIAQGCKRKPINLAGKTTLDELKALVASAKVVIGTDTGPTHIAAAFQIPVLSISPTKFVKSLRWGPWQTVNKIVGNPKQCNWICNPYQCVKLDCLEAIDVKSAFDELMILMEKPPRVENNKREWFRASINIGIYGHNPEYTARLKKINLSVYKLDIPWWRLDKIISFIWQRDINVIHLFPGKMKWYWKGIVRQLSALRLYCPPVICDFPDTVDDPIEDYMKAFYATD